MEYEFCWNLAGREYSREKTIPKNEGILSRSSAFSLIFCCILFGNNEIPRSTYTNSPEFKIEPNNAKWYETELSDWIIFMLAFKDDLWCIGKMSLTQKKLSRKLRQDYLKEVDYAFTTLSDSSNILIFWISESFLNSVQGKMDDPETCKIYGYLISTLNSSYPDYDFRFERRLCV